MPRVHINNVQLGNLKCDTRNGKMQALSIHSGAEAFSHKDKTFVPLRTETSNALITAVYYSFAQHIPLELSPDVIFNTILQGVSMHVSTDPEKFRNVFVFHAGKKELITRNDCLVKGNWDNNWEVSIADLGRQIMEDMSGQEAKTVLSSKFSTTTLAESTAHVASFMDVVKHYYKYTVMTMCGIPYIDILGTRDDWVKIARNITPLLTRLGLSSWNKELLIVLQHFINAFDGDVDLQFWNSIFYYHGALGSGGVASVSGWIAKLFLYVKDGINPLLQNTTRTKSIAFANFPVCLTSTPFKWKYLTTQYDMKLMSGLVGITLSATGSLKPEVGWLIASGNSISVI